jgi:hypothetical protein
MLRKVVCLPFMAVTMASAVVQAQGAKLPERAIRRDIPMTNTIRRAMAAGTRDSTGRPGRNYWQLRTDYTINARLDVTTSRITGRERIDLWNNSPDSLRTLVFRLDMNMFLFNVPRLAPWVPAELTDGFVITKMTVNGEGVNLSPPPQQGGRGAPAPVTENIARAFNTTRGTVQLARAIAARSKVAIEIEWNHKVPGGPGANHRMTQRWGDTLYQPTQWYPRLAVYDDLRGWDPELYLGPSEFYNNFGKFDVSIDVPAGWIVSGTGVLQNPNDVLTQTARDRLATVLKSDAEVMIVGPDEVGPGKATAMPAAGSDRLVWHLVADTVNDFAWATAKKFNWRATRANIPTKGFVPVNMYYLPGRSAAYDSAGVFAKHALEFYSKLWFPYQFPQLTLQDGPSAGMEYPMVINSNAGAADHETFHQWAPMTVSNNETWYGWMDEGFNQYANILSGADRRGTAPNLDGRGRSYGNSSGDECEIAMMGNANYGQPCGPGYSFTTYGKTPLMLSSLGGVVGSDTAVQRAQSEFGKAWMFKHPSPWDYMFAMSNSLKAKPGVNDLSWFWNYWLFTTESNEASLVCGDLSGARPTLTVKQDGQMPSPIILRVDFAADGPPIKPMPGSVMSGDRVATLTVPADVWFTGDKTYKAQLNFGGRKIEKVTLDPGGRFPDKDATDNQCPRATPAVP